MRTGTGESLRVTDFVTVGIPLVFSDPFVARPPTTSAPVGE
ncbi:MAG: hypothetical protein SW019_16015 [Actinomycetota bacterium]|nr:hypothetical protein [Actinomycetota bacterium]